MAISLTGLACRYKLRQYPKVVHFCSLFAPCPTDYNYLLSCTVHSPPGGEQGSTG
jgi:hypothetical protein